MAVAEHHVIMAGFIKRAAEIEDALESNREGVPTPLQIVLHQSKEAAIDAVAEMIGTDPVNIQKMRALQSRVQVFFDLVSTCRAVIDRAKDAERELAMSQEDKRVVEAMVFDEDIPAQGEG